MEVVRLPLDYETLVYKLIQDLSSIYSVVIVEGENDIVYSTDNWDISADITNICSSWNSMKAPFIMVFGVKFTMIECEIDSMVATSLLGKGHIVGVKDEERKIITFVASSHWCKPIPKPLRSKGSLLRKDSSLAWSIISALMTGL